MRLILRVASDSAEQAAPTFIAHLVENGLTDWVYQVCDPDTMEPLGYFDGFGLPVDVEESQPAEAKAPEAPETPDPDPAPVQTPVQTDGETDGETDADLLALAQHLNDADAPPAEQPVEQPTPAPATE